MMKSWKYVMMGLAAALLTVSCGGGGGDDEPTPTPPTPKPEAKLVLSSDKSQITADGKDAATLTVKLGNDVVSTGYTIYDGDNKKVTLTDGKFTTTAEGTYKFWASYSGKNSETIEIKAVKAQGGGGDNPNTPDDPNKDNLNFKRRVLMIQFTGTGCQFCPGMINMLSDMLPKEEVKNNSVFVAVHSFNSTDPAYLGAAGSALANQCGVTSYPTLNFDLNVSSQQYNSVEYNEKILTAQLNRTKAKVGISAASTYDAATRTVSLTAAVKAAEEGEYRIGAWVIEDGIKATQATSGQFPGDWKDFIHNNCVRYCDSKQSTYDYSGHDLGKITKGTTVEYNFQIQLAEKIKSDKSRLIVFVTSSEVVGTRKMQLVNNVIKVPLSGSVAFEYQN